MTVWICRTCAVEHPDTDEPPEVCEICADERQYVPAGGQQWTTLADLAVDGRRVVVEEIEPDLFGISVEPRVGIGQRALLVRSRVGNLLWDPTGYLDDDGARLAGAVFDHNPWLFDLVLKRLLRGPEGQAFPVGVFETAAFFGL